MKKIIFTLLLVGVFGAYAQPVKQLEKYSYFCFAVNNNKSINGTCFFYKKNNDVYLVTNYHVFYATDIIGNKRWLDVDTMRVNYTSAKTGEQRFFKVASDKASPQFFNHYDMPDLVAKKVKNIPDDFNISFINDVFSAANVDQKPDSVIAFGYPCIANKVSGIDNIITQKCYITTNAGVSEVDIFDPCLCTEQPDRKARKIKRKIAKTEFQIAVGALPGFSGSPVYGRFLIRGKYEYRFIGIVFASDMVKNASAVISANTFEDYMKKISI